jgi:hypothetical protein
MYSVQTNACESSARLRSLGVAGRRGLGGGRGIQGFRQSSISAILLLVESLRVCIGFGGALPKNTLRGCLPIMSPNPRRARLLQVIAGILGMVALGLFSSLVSRESCEFKTAHWLTEEKSPFFLPIDSVNERTLKAWKSTDGDFEIHEPGKTVGGPIPWRCMKSAQIRGPFLASVEYSWVRRELAGRGGDVWYVCLFGFSIRCCTTITRAS